MFSQYEGVSVRYASKPGELEGADMIILPGTKSTLGDMKWLRESGMEAMIKKLNFGGVPVFGVCGGYQMLGRRISDPETPRAAARLREWVCWTARRYSEAKRHGQGYRERYRA